MSEVFENKDGTAIRKEIELQEKKYLTALKADEEFHVLKKIKLVINKLKTRLIALENIDVGANNINTN